MEIYINRDGTQYGPYSIDDINTYLQDGNFSPSDLSWHEGLAEWIPISSLEGILLPQWGNAEQAESEPVAEPVAVGGSKKKKILIFSGVGVLVSAVVFAAVYFLFIKKDDIVPDKSVSTAKNNGSRAKKNVPDPGKGVELPLGTGSETNSAVMISFAKEIQPILQNKCVKCHGEDAAPDKIKGKLNLTDREGIEKGGENKDAIKPGKPDESLIIKRVNDDKDPMPPENKGTRLTDEEKTKIKAWIAQGAKFD